MAEAKASKTRRSADDVRADIVECASQLFADRGFAAVTTRDICEASGVSMSGVYRHFRDKQSLYMHCVIAAFQAVQDDTWGLLDRDIGDRELLFQFTRALCEIHSSNNDVTKIVLRQMLEQDSELLQKVSEALIVDPSQRLMERAKNIVGEERAVELIYRIFSMSFGFPHIQPMLALLGWAIPKYDDLSSMAVAILSMACPDEDWSEFRDARALSGAHA